METIDYTMPATDLVSLMRDAEALLHADRITPSPHPTMVEETIRRTHQLVAGDIAEIQQRLHARETIEYAELFGTRFDEKLAALIYLTAYRLLDAVYLPSQWLDSETSVRDLGIHLEMLFRTGAVEGLRLIYDFAAAQQEKAETAQETQAAQRWLRICLRCLYLMAQLTDSREYVIAFLKAREHARRQIEQLMATNEQAVADTVRALGMAYVQARKNGVIPELPAVSAAYAEHYQRYEPPVWDAQALGLVSLLFAHEHIRQALASDDQAALLAWLAHGSPAAFAAVLNAARDTLTINRYAALLEQFLLQEQVEPQRMAAVVLELGAINRKVQRDGGEDELNRILFFTALTDDGYRAEIARLAVHELGTVAALDAILNVVEEAPIIEVAEEGIRVLRDMRRLLMAESIIRRRALLTAAYDRARECVNNAHHMLEAAFAAPTAETAKLYVDQLRDLNAFPELQQLAQQNAVASPLARQVLSEHRLQAKIDAR